MNIRLIFKIVLLGSGYIEPVLHDRVCVSTQAAHGLQLLPVHDRLVGLVCRGVSEHCFVDVKANDARSHHGHGVHATVVEVRLDAHHL